MTTLLHLLVDRARTNPEQLATIAKRRGRWIPTTASDFVDRIAATAVGLAEAGLTTGDRVAILVGNVPDWLIVDLAVQSVGAVSVAIPADHDDAAVGGLLAGVDVSMLVVEDPTDAARIRSHLADEAQHSAVQFVCLGEGEDGFTGVDELIAAGTDALGRNPDAYTQLVERLDAGAPATATFTAGAAGRERPIVHRALDLVNQARRVAANLGLEPNDVTVASLDPSHPFERAVTIYPALVSGAVLAYPENTSTTTQSMLEVRPTFVHLPVDRVRAATATVHARFRRNRGLKRLVGAWWSRSALEAVQNGRRPSRLAVRIVGRPALKSLGWENLSTLLITGARVPLDVLMTMQALGAPVRGGYATVETGLVAAGVPRSSDGLPVLDDVSVSVSDGQLLVDSDGVSSVELSDTSEPRVRAVATGDRANLLDRSVMVLGPERSVVTNRAGASVLAAEIESALRDSPYIALARVRVDSSSLHVDIEIDFDSVSDWAAERKLHFTTFASLVAIDDVSTLIADEVARLAPDIEHHDLLTSPFQQGRDITRTGSTIHRGPGGDNDTVVSSTEHESAGVE